MYFSIILILFSFSMGQEVQIKNLKDNPGILPVYQGQAKIQTDRHDFIHYYPLQPIAEKIAYIEQQFENVTNIIKTDLNDLHYLNDFFKDVHCELRRVQEKFTYLFPFIRTKIAFSDDLDSAIKAGNIDQKDTKYYNEAIKTLTKNNKNIMSQVNHHMSLNTKIMETFQEKISLISQNQSTIAKEINEIKINYHAYAYYSYKQTQNVLNQLNIILQFLLQLLDDLEEAVNLTKINILHRSLIKEEELSWIITSMLEHHSKEQLLYPKDEDFYKYYNIIEVDAYYTNNTIVFILHIPIIFPSPFSYYHLFSIPTQNLLTIIPFAPYLLTNHDLFQYNELPCKKIGQEFLCEKKLLQDISSSEDCVIQILQIENETAFCENIPVVLNSTMIEEISEAHYIAIFPNSTEVHTSCSNSTVLDLQGTYLIELPPGCEFKTSKKSFINSQINIMKKPLALRNIKTINVQNVVKMKPLKLDKIHLDELNKLIKDEEHLQLVPIKESATGNIHYWVIPVYILLTILLLFIGYKICSMKRKKIKKKETKRESFEAEVLGLNFDSFDSLKMNGENERIYETLKL